MKNKIVKQKMTKSLRTLRNMKTIWGNGMNSLGNISVEKQKFSSASGAWASFVYLLSSHSFPWPFTIVAPGNNIIPHKQSIKKLLKSICIKHRPILSFAAFRRFVWGNFYLLTNSAAVVSSPHAHPPFVCVSLFHFVCFLSLVRNIYSYNACAACDTNS